MVLARGIEQRDVTLFATGCKDAISRIPTSPFFETPDVSPFFDFGDTFYRHVASRDISTQPLSVGASLLAIAVYQPHPSQLFIVTTRD